MLQFIIFLFSSLGILSLSRHALRNPRLHGFPRFFAFEAILGLVVLNAGKWFAQPFSLPQLVSWALLLVSAFLVVHALKALRQFGMPDKSIQDASRLAFEKTTRLVTEGPYRFIRHPMYDSLLCLAWGVMLKHVTGWSVLLAGVATVALYVTARLEEQENLRIFGQEYANYMISTRRFIPFLF